MKRTPLDIHPTDMEIELFNTVLQKLKTNFTCAFTNNFNFDFSLFTLLKGYSKVEPGPSININDGNENSYVSFLRITNHIVGLKNQYDLIEYYAWGVCFLKQNFGHVIIRPETINDKILEFLNPVEIDFEEDKEFSKRFYVIADSNFDSQFEISDSFRKAISEIKSKDFMIEILNNQLIIGDKKLINPDTVLDFAIFQNKIVNK